MRRIGLIGLAVGLTVAAVRAPRAQQSAATGTSVSLAPTNHPRVPAELSLLWLAPDPPTGSGRGRTAAMSELASAVKLEVDGDFVRALAILSQPSLQQGPLEDYATYYAGLAELRLGREADARRTFRSLREHELVGYLAEAAALREAESNEAVGDRAAAVEIYERLSKTRTPAPDEVLMRLGKAARAAGDAEKASRAFSRLYYEFPLSDLASLASSELASLPNAPGDNRFALELGRAERLFGSKRYAQARTAFEGLRKDAQGEDRELVGLRLGECDYFLKRPRNTRDEVRPYIDRPSHTSHQAEALFFYAVAVRQLGDQGQYLKIIRRLADQFSTESWAEEALNNLATRYVVQNDDDQADEAFRELYQKFPTGRYAERAAWKIGWRSYKNGRYGHTTRVFERASGDFPRSDYRPSWLYWSGRAHDALNQPALAEARYTLVATDYLNSYYGRLAVSHLQTPLPRRRLIVSGGDIDGASGSGGAPAPAIAPLPPNHDVVRALLELELYDQAIDELHYAQKVWGDSSPIQATFGWIFHERGDLRAGINAMKRAYPQYLAAGGEELPAELLKVLFPVNYWSQIRHYASEHRLDPYLMAALIAQESTFTADVRSAANAYGLMQIVPSTGRYYAKTLHLPRFSIKMLTTAEINLRMGTAYFADLVKQFGDAHYALASYNAGESRVIRWIAERRGVERDQFIDDIPFPETQQYVRKILGTAEDYRRLYGPGSGRADAGEVDPAPLPVVAHQAATPATTAKVTPTSRTSSARGKAAAKKKTGAPSSKRKA